jgi:N-acetylglutamate synthase-like GNAT family acetyltransferase
MRQESATQGEISLRTGLRPGDAGYIIYMHGRIYEIERGFDPTFEAYVATYLAEFARSATERERIWIAERDGTIIGCVAIVAAAPETAQLRWFLVDPSVRGAGLGRRLIEEAIAFCEACGYTTVILWTENALAAAGHLYQSAGFRKVEAKPGRMGGQDVIEEKYELRLR